MTARLQKNNFMGELKVSKFGKVSFEQFSADMNDAFPDASWTTSDLEALYDAIKLPERATTGSAGYDIYTPSTIQMTAGEYVKFPTGIRWVCDESDGNKVLIIVPRSGLGFREKLRLANTVGVIDSDYWQSDNEGDIWAKITADSSLDLSAGQAFLQGIILPFEITSDDNASGVRNGGFGSTDTEEES